ncbi:MAG: PAS domain S-box protein, partial [Deltaproteobacteria bacterium]|nr:PAS domain S-box protein [Deltaproteobacteria bacterium]
MDRKKFLSLTRWLLCLALAVAVVSLRSVSPAADGPKRVVVVGDRSYAPFEFFDATGQPQGIFVDIYRLWSEKTGIEVEYRLMTWEEVLKRLKDGQADVIGGIFPSPEREQLYDFSMPYYEIPVNIFFRNNIYGISKLEDLVGFKIGVVKEDFSEDVVRKKVPQAVVVTYATFEDLVRAAVEGEINVFVADTPVAIFHLNKLGRADTFKYSEKPIFSSKVCAAVRKGDAARLALLNTGIGMITNQEKEVIKHRWIGVSLVRKIPWRLFGLGSFLVLIIVAVILFWNYQLRRRVALAALNLNAQAATDSLLAKISTRFIRFKTDDFDLNITRALQDIGEFMAVERTCLFVSDRPGLMRKTHEWRCPDLEDVSVMATDEFDLTAVPWTYERLRLWETVGDPELVNNKEMSEARKLREFMWSARSIIVTPIMYGGNLVGVIVACTILNSKTFQTHEIKLLKMAAEIFANALEHERGGEALRESENRYRVVLDSSADPIIVYDHERKVNYTNSAFSRAFGWTPEEISNRELNFIPEEKQSEMETAMQRLASGPEDYLYFESIRLDKNHLPIDVSVSMAAHRSPEGGLLAVITNLKDITAWKRAEKDLQQSQVRFKKLYEKSLRTEEVYRSLFDASADAIVLYDLAGRTRYVSPSFTKIFGWTLDEVVNARIPFLPDGEKETTLKIISDIIKTGTPCHGYESKRMSKDGRLLDVSISASRYDDHAGRPDGLLVVLRDITQQKLLQAQLQHAQKMDAVGALAGGVAHDFNNILQAIMGYIQLLLLDKNENHPEYEELRAIEQAARRATELTQQLLTFSRKVESKKRPMELNLEIRQVKKLLARTIPKMIAIDLDLTDDLGLIDGDPAQIEQVLMNLGVNAKDAMPEGGRLSFKTRNVTLDEEYCRMHPGMKPGSFAQITISDTGQGMDREVQEHIFEPFFTTKELGKGTGLGLSIVYGVVKDHGGNITCYSQPGQGTEFRVYLPELDIEACLEQDPAAEEMPPGGDETILLVDDEASISNLVTQLLDTHGYHVLTAANGFEALQLYQHNAGQIALVSLDFDIPEL